MQIEHISTTEVARWVARMIEAGHPESAILTVLFGVDRLACCDEALAVSDDEQVLGLVSLSPEGEMGEGSAILALYVLPQHRRGGAGTRLMVAAVERMVERGLVPVRVELLSTAAAKLVEALPVEVQQHIEAVEQPPAIDIFHNRGKEKEEKGKFTLIKVTSDTKEEAAAALAKFFEIEE